MCQTCKRKFRCLQLHLAKSQCGVQARRRVPVKRQRSEGRASDDDADDDDDDDDDDSPDSSHSSDDDHDAEEEIEEESQKEDPPVRPTPKRRGRKPGPTTVARREILAAAAGALEEVQRDVNAVPARNVKKDDRLVLPLSEIAKLWPEDLKLIGKKWTVCN